MFISSTLISFFFFFNDTATTEIYTLSLHDALPIYPSSNSRPMIVIPCGTRRGGLNFGSGLAGSGAQSLDRKSTRLNSSHGYISYAVFCLKKKKIHTDITITLHTSVMHLRPPSRHRA